MMRPILIIALFVTTYLNVGDACLYKRPPETKTDQNIWDVEKYERATLDCDCGKADTATPNWNINIQTKNNDDGSFKNCTGTIVTSDLIVTSHKCLALNEQRMRLVDLFQFKFGELHMSAKDQIIVTHPKDESIHFQVLKIFYNPQYALSSEEKIYPVNDVVILQVQADFISLPDFKPVCLPFFAEALDDEDIVGQKGNYYGALENATDEVVVYHGDIFKKGACYAENDIHKKKELMARSAKTTLCLRYEDQADDIPKVEGGPLLVTIDATHTTFLVGIADDVNSPNSSEAKTGLAGSMGDHYTFFSGINPVVKFIEYYADKVKSKWCRTPTDKVLNTTKASRAGGRSLPKPEKPWPWDIMKTDGARAHHTRRRNRQMKRDESLDCTCGLQNTRIGGRVVGGVEATPREFGWMTNILLFPFGRDGGAALCGGAVINDRMILTAAHCVVSDQKLEADPKADATISPENVKVTLNAHLQQNDPNGIPKEVMAVLFHPDYLDSRLSNPQYYDSDIALLVLKDKLKFEPDDKRGIRPICLPEYGKYRPIVGKTAWVVGWGLTDPQDSGSTSNKLQKLDVPIADLQLCNETAITKVTDMNICAGSLNMYRDAAAGDSGGPLQIEDTETSQWYEVGAVSWGEDVTVGEKTLTAALYADVQKLMPFVDYHSQRVRAKWCRSTRGETR